MIHDSDTDEALRRLVAQALRRPEGRRLEFKHAALSFDKDKAAMYSAALANEGGGLLILGVDDRTRAVVGTNAFRDPVELERYLFEHLKTVAVRVAAVDYQGHRLVVLQIPPRPIGQTVVYKGRRLFRAGESLTDMPDSAIASVLAERRDQVLLAGSGVRPARESLDEVLDLDLLFAAMGRSCPVTGLVAALE
ncbi:MAG: ATP-binding protein, partial [Microbacteriaceae bacterium]|nr:ATP-binding protein [Microbacteriaceae bacterium]